MSENYLLIFYEDPHDYDTFNSYFNEILFF